MSEFIIECEYDHDDGWIPGEYREEIVRCCDCKYHHGRMCMFPDGVGDFKRWYVEDDDYCSDGKVKGA